MKDSSKKGALLVVIAGICWGIIGIFTRKLSAIALDSVQVTWIRNSLAALGMFICIAVTDRKRFFFNLKDIWMFIGTGILSIVLFNICYFKAIEITTMSVAAVLLYTAPAMVIIMSCFLFKEKLTGQKVLALLLALGGCILTTGLIGSNASISLSGVIIGLGSGFGYALYSIFGNIALKKYHPFTVTFYTFLLAGLTLTPFSRVEEISGAVSEHGYLIMYCIGLAAISTLIPFLCYTEGLKYLETGKASVMAFIEPLVATLCGVLFFHERITVQNGAGMLLIFISMLLLNIKYKKE